MLLEIMGDKTKIWHEKQILFTSKTSQPDPPFLKNLACLFFVFLSPHLTLCSLDLHYLFSHTQQPLFHSECCPKYSLIFNLKFKLTMTCWCVWVSREVHHMQIVPAASAGCPASWSSCRAPTSLLWICCRETSNTAPCCSRTQTLLRPVLINQKSFIFNSLLKCNLCLF